ncbi:MAG: polymer-forming cytoskeletal protein [Alphaproteobacteria bacterium]|nr:polymer-forming cytoskeletal protein [Alphaproteobacteria bacterium]MDH5557683.1 polymer-forming cytoskeletal protein [Alphaproteobacteria bacterium]
MSLTSASDKTGKSNVPSIISSNLTMTGNLNTSGDIQIDGTVDGDVQSKQITLGESGVVNGAIVADLARISGSVNGSITARVVELGRSAKITGDINHFSLAIEPGAFIQGQLTHVDEQKLKAPAGNGVDIKPAGVLAADADKKTADAGKGLPN